MMKQNTTWISGLGIGTTVFMLALVHGFPGIVAGGLLVVFWMAGPVLYAVGYGQIAVGALFSLNSAFSQIMLAELGLLYALLIPNLALDRPAQRVMSALIGVGLFVGGISIAIFQDIGAGNIGIILLCVLGVVAYSMHRYERVAVGAVEGSHE